MSREENIATFENTRRLCNADPYLSSLVGKSRWRQEVILEDAKIIKPAPKYEEPAQIIVTKRRSFEAARHYAGYETCVLNFASATRPGGGVTTGSTAQEESLCRCSTLYSCLTANSVWNRFYAPHRQQKDPLYNDDCIYTPDVIVFKSDDQHPVLLEQEDWLQCNVISCAAPNLRPDHTGRIRIIIREDALEELHIQRARRILEIATTRGNDVVILGAFGCGAFKNPPEIVAKAIKQAVEEYRYFFKIIEFAVYCTPADERNYEVFKKVFAGDN